MLLTKSERKYVKGTEEKLKRAFGRRDDARSLHVTRLSRRLLCKSWTTGPSGLSFISNWTPNLPVVTRRKFASTAKSARDEKQECPGEDF